MPKKNCLRCGHEWQPLRENPVTCPRCKSYIYNVPRTKPRIPRRPRIVPSEVPQTKPAA